MEFVIRNTITNNLALDAFGDPIKFDTAYQAEQFARQYIGYLYRIEKSN